MFWEHTKTSTWFAEIKSKMETDMHLKEKEKGIIVE